MGIATVFVVPSSVEPVLWLVIFVICAVVIARARTGRPFLHGLAVGVANSIWITAAHILFFDTYLASHARELQMMQGSAPAVPGRVKMLVTGPLIGVVSGCVLGLFALVAARFWRTKAGPDANRAA